MASNLELSLKIKSAVEGLGEVDQLAAEIEKMGGDATEMRAKAAELSAEFDRLKQQQDLINQFKALDGAAKTAADGMEQSRVKTQALETQWTEAKANVAALTTALNQAKTALSLEADPSKIKALNAEIKSLESQLKSADKSAAQLGEAFETSKNRTEVWADAAHKSSTSLKDVQAAMTQAGVSAENLDQAEAKVGVAMAAVKTEALQLQKNVRDTAEGMKSAEQASSGLESGTTKAGSSMSLLSTAAAKAMAAFAALAGVIASLRGLTQTATDFDRIDATLKNVFGSAEQAGREFEFVRDVSARLGLDLQSAATAYSKLAASSKDTALEGEQTRRIFEAVSNAMAKTGASSDETEGALLAIGQMMSKGTVQAEELRGQLGERLPGAFNLAAKAMGVSTAELGNMLQQGGVLATDLLPKLAAALNQAFGAEQVNTLQGNLNRISTAWKDMREAMAESINLKGAIEEVSTYAQKVRDYWLAFAPVGDTTAKLQAQHDALVRLLSDWLTWDDSNRREKLLQVNAALEEMAKKEQAASAATQAAAQAARDAKLAEADREAALKKTAAALDSSAKQLDAETRALQSNSQSRIETLKSQLASAEASAQESRAAGLNTQALGFEQQAIAKAGELRAAEIQQANALAAAKQQAMEIARQHLQTILQEANADGKLVDSEKEALAAARADVAAKQEQAQAARLHAEELQRLPASLAAVIPPQAALNDAVQKQAAAARDAITAAQQLRQEQQAGRATTEQVAQAEQAAAVAVAQLTQAVAQASKTQDERIASNHRTIASNQEMIASDRELGASFEGIGVSVAEGTGQSTQMFDIFTAKVLSFGEKGKEFMQSLNGLLINNFDQLFKMEAEWSKTADEQAQQVDDLTQRAKKAVDTSADLALMAQLNVNAFDHLDQQHLQGLQQAIDQARQKLEQLNDQARNTLQSLQDELYQLEGNMAASENLRYQQKMADLQAQMDAARKSGSQQAIDDLQQALNLETQIHNRKMAAIREEQQAQQQSQSEASASRQTAPRAASGPALPAQASAPAGGGIPIPSKTIMVQLAGPSGQAVPLIGNASNEADLLAILAAAKAVGNA